MGKELLLKPLVCKYHSDMAHIPDQTLMNWLEDLASQFKNSKSKLLSNEEKDIIDKLAEDFVRISLSHKMPFWTIDRNANWRTLTGRTLKTKKAAVSSEQFLEVIKN